MRKENGDVRRMEVQARRALINSMAYPYPEERVEIRYSDEDGFIAFLS
jgi:hypothetical protein